MVVVVLEVLSALRAVALVARDLRVSVILLKVVPKLLNPAFNRALTVLPSRDGAVVRAPRKSLALVIRVRKVPVVAVSVLREVVIPGVSRAALGAGETVIPSSRPPKLPAIDPRGPRAAANVLLRVLLHLFSIEDINLRVVPSSRRLTVLARSVLVVREGRVDLKTLTFITISVKVLANRPPTMR